MRLFVPLLLAYSVSLAGQSQSSAPVPSPEPSTVPIEIPAQEALAHRIGHDKPVYPRFALAAGVSGTVKAILTINSDGYPDLGGPVYGPPPLLASTRAWIAASKFRPFLRDGEPVDVTTTLPVVFTLPPGTHSAHPPAVLRQRNITSTIEREGPDSPPRAHWSRLSPAVRDWIARYQQVVTSGHKPASPDIPFGQIVASESYAPPLTQMPDNLAIYPISLTLPHRRLYLLFDFSKICVKTNCLIGLLDESPAGVSLALSTLGIDVDLHRRYDSPYPDVLIWSDSGQEGISSISGYSYYGGQWGQLYCGTDDANEDSERDEEIAEHHGTHIPQPPLVTLCK
jgi:Gram-negative bacterial TonB protein C-terminal